MPHQAEILAVGTELLLGNITNTNAQFLSELLASAGIDVLYHTAVGDNPQRLRAAVETARGRCDLLVFTGGLGPTYDDMTKETVVEAFGLALAGTAAGIPSNLVQAVFGAAASTALAAALGKSAYMRRAFPGL